MKDIFILIGDITKSAGTERAISNLANLLSESYLYNITIISMNSKLGSSCYYPLNMNVNIVHMNLQSSSFINRVYIYVLFIIKLRKISKENNIDFAMGSTHALNIFLAFLPTHIRKIGCEHITYHACPWYSRPIRKLFYQKLDALVVLTKADAQNYNFIKKNRLYIIPNSLSFTSDKPAELKNKRIITVGRLSKQKGYDLLIKSAVLIKEKLPDWRIDVFGEGEEGIKLNEMIKMYSLSDYIYINKPTKNIKNELLQSSLYIMSSRWEGFPMILLEAKACGLPIVSFNCPEGPADLIDNGRDGFLINNGDLKQLSDRIVQLCNDEVLRSNMGNNSFESAAKYSNTAIYPLWNMLLNEVYFS